jgi:hypothetical protein
LGEANELFQGWDEHPPTNLLLKAIAVGFGVIKKPEIKVQDDTLQHQQAFDAMQRAAMHEIAVKAGPRLPILQGPDLGLPKAKPIFDIEELLKRNANVVQQRAERRLQKNVGN